MTRRSLLVGVGATAIAAHTAAAFQATPTGSVRLEVTPNPVPVDQPFAVRVTGLEPDVRVTLRAAVPDALALQWWSEGTFIADRGGVVDLAAQAPVEGTWTTADPTGLVWSAAPSGGAEWRFFAHLLYPDPTVITAEVAGVEVARVDVERPLLTPAVADATVAEQGLEGRFFRPAEGGPFPGVLVLGGSEGGLHPFTAVKLATHGFATLALAYFGVVGLPPTLAEIPLEYFADALAWLRAQPSVAPGPLAVVGQSRGGELALLLGATFPEVGAVVSYVGSGLVSSSPTDFSVSAWTYRGEPVPQFFDLNTANNAAIPVERINGPVLLISGEDDLLWPSALLSDIAMDRLVARGHAHPHEHLRYPDAGHFILPPLAPTTFGLEEYGGTAAGLAAASANSWPHVLAVLGARTDASRSATAPPG